MSSVFLLSGLLWPQGNKYSLDFGNTLACNNDHEYDYDDYVYDHGTHNEADNNDHKYDYNDYNVYDHGTHNEADKWVY